jgi:hypothetical protein
VGDVQGYLTNLYGIEIDWGDTLKSGRKVDIFSRSMVVFCQLLDAVAG